MSLHHMRAYYTFFKQACYAVSAVNLFSVFFFSAPLQVKKKNWPKTQQCDQIMSSLYLPYTILLHLFLKRERESSHYSGGVCPNNYIMIFSKKKAISDDYKPQWEITVL